MKGAAQDTPVPDRLYRAVGLFIDVPAPRHPQYRFVILIDSGDPVESTLLPPRIDIDDWGLQAARHYFAADHPAYGRLPPATSLYDAVFAFYDGLLPAALREARAWARRARGPRYDLLPKREDGFEPLLLEYEQRHAEALEEEQRRGQPFSVDELREMGLAHSGYPA